MLGKATRLQQAMCCGAGRGAWNVICIYAPHPAFRSITRSSAGCKSKNLGKNLVDQQLKKILIQNQIEKIQDLLGLTSNFQFVGVKIISSSSSFLSSGNSKSSLSKFSSKLQFQSEPLSFSSSETHCRFVLFSVTLSFACRYVLRSERM